MNTLASLIAVLFVGIACAAIALPKANTDRSYVETHLPRRLDIGWTYHSKADLSQTRSFIIAVERQNTDKLDQLFREISDPKSPSYAQYLTIEELTDLIAPKQSSLDAVHNFLASHGINKYHLTKNKDYITFTTTLEQARTMFDTEFHTFQHDDSGKKYTSSLGPYTLPTTVASVVDFVGGIVGLPLLKKLELKKTDSAFTYQLGPKDLRQRYNVSMVGGTASGNAQSVAEFQGQYYSPSDLKQFFQQYQSEYSSYDTVTKVYGTNDPNEPGTEAELDIQYIMGVAPKVPTWFWSNPNQDFWSDITAWLSQMDDEPNNPFVHSISYGVQGSYPSKSYRQNTNTAFQKLGTRGISIIFASGDSGTGCNLCYYFEPSFPATSPYVTSVGATRFLNNGVGPEGAVEAFSSGGGFSWLFDIPSYQSAAVANFFKTSTKLPSAGYYNAKGRGTPDVAAMGIGFSVVVSGSTTSVGGTSASSPTFAGIVSLLNEVQLLAGKKQLGFLNPWLYQTSAAHGDAFYDVTVGSNAQGCCGEGFSCQVGWDPVTGLGTPNFERLKNYLP